MSGSRMFYLKQSIEALFGLAVEICLGPEEMKDFAKWIRDQLDEYGI